MKKNRQSQPKGFSSLTILILGLGIVTLFGLAYLRLGSPSTGEISQTSSVVSPSAAPSPVPTTVPAQNDQTEGWRTLSGQRFKYTLRFPSEMELTERGDSIYLVILGPTQGQGQEFHDGLMVGIRELKKGSGVTFDDFVEREISKVGTVPSSITVESREKTNLAGLTSVKITGNELGSRYVQTLVPHGEWVLSIKANYGGEKEQYYLQLISRILTTLKLE